MSGISPLFRSSGDFSAWLAAFAAILALPLQAVTPEPYAPEPHPGPGALASQSSTPFFTADFSKPAAAWRTLAPAYPDSHGAGRLPQGWIDFTASPETGVRYGRFIDDGLPMLHIAVEKARKDRAAAAAGVDLGEIASGTIVKISLTLRSPTRTPARLVIISTEDTASGGTSTLLRKPAWEQTIKGDSGWHTLDCQWQSTIPPGRFRLALVIERPGVFDISALSIGTIRTEHLQNLLANDPAFSAFRAPANALRHTRFPLGLPTGWTYAPTVADGEDMTVATDPATPGPSDAPSLKITTAPALPSDASLFGEYFVLPRFWTGHVFSLSIKGRATGTIRIASGFDVLATRKFAITEADGWKRLALDFQPRTLTDEYFLQLSLAGEVWIDGLRVAASNDPEPRDYAPPAPVEITLASPSPARVTFSGEPSDAPARRVEWTVLASPDTPAGAVLRAKAVNLYRRQIRLPDTPLDASRPLLRGAWTLPDFPEPFGAHRIEAWIENPATGARIGAPDEIVIHRLPRPRHLDTDAPESPFGTHVWPSRRHLEMAKAAGVNWVRLHDGGTIAFTGWHFLEKERGKWTFRDRPLQRYREHHLLILGQLGTAPAWTTALRHVGPRSWTDSYYQPEDMDAWQKYVRTITARYRDQIRAWEIWNEPWLSGFWRKGVLTDSAGRTVNDQGDTAPEDFARLTQSAVAAARSVDPAFTIVGLNTTAGSHSTKGRNFAGDDWTRRYAEAGGIKNLSAVSYHQYAFENAGYPGDSIERGYKTAVGPVSESSTGRPAIPVWMTEGSVIQGRTGRGFYYQTLPFAPDVEESAEAVSDRLLRYITALLAAGDARIFLYAMHKHGRFDNGNKYRVLLGEDGYLHPVAVAHAALAWRLEGKPFRRIIEIAPDTRAYVFSNDTAWTAVLIPRPDNGGAKAGRAGPSAVSLRERGRIVFSDLFGNPLESATAPPDRVFFATGDGPFSDHILSVLKP
ncbi:MAG: hypothetical protein LBK99_18275 [Opitutaceae bacterium]|jgi:hypothetical protein|nr:hypothetical protein [Opitutaceae bacterium]